MFNSKIDSKDLACVDVVFIGTVEGFCEHGNEISRFLKGGKFFDQLSNSASQKTVLLHKRFSLCWIKLYPLKVVRMSGGTAPCILTSALDGGELWASCSAELLPGEELPVFTGLEAVCVPKSVRAFLIWEKSIAPAGIDPHILGLPARRPATYRSATSAPYTRWIKYL